MSETKPEVRKATDGRTRLRDGWRDIHDRFTAEEIAEHGLTPSLRRDAGSYTLHVRDASPSAPGPFEWEVKYNGQIIAEKSGYASTYGEGMRRADAAFDRLEAKRRKMISRF